MKRHAADDRSEKYVRDAKQKLESLRQDIEELRSRPSNQPDVAVKDWELSIAKIGPNLNKLRKQVDGLKRGTEQKWSDLQAEAELHMWDLRAAVERAKDESAPLLSRADDDVPLYFVEKSPEGRWGLRRQGASRVVKYFDSKNEAVRFGRSYARRKSPSRLITRRLDGTFQSVQSYR